MVRLVEYPVSSDEDLDVVSDDESPWPSFAKSPPSPSDSFSCPMPSPESDEDDEDYAPSESSLGDASSVTSSVDTDDLDPDRTIEEHDVETMEDVEKPDFCSRTERDEVIALTQKDATHVFYAWNDLRAAFEDNPFKRRSVAKQVETGNGRESEAKQDELREKEAGTWGSEAAFAPGVAEKKPRVRRRTAATHSRFTGVSPSLKINVTDHTAAAALKSASTRSIEGTKTVDRQTMGKISLDTMRLEPRKALVPPEALVTNATESRPLQHSSVPAPSARVSSIDHVEEPRKPYKFAEHGRKDVSSSMASESVQTAGEQEDSAMRCQRSSAPSTTRSPRNGEFLFGQSYKNRFSFGSLKPTKTETMRSTGWIKASGSVDESTRSTRDTASGTIDKPAAAFAFFTTGVAGPKVHKRPSFRRRTRSGTSAACTQASNNSAKASPSDGVSLDPVFDSSLYQAPASSHEQPMTTAIPSSTSFGLAGATSPTPASEMASTVPLTQPATGFFSFWKSKPRGFQASSAFSPQTDTFKSANASATATTDASEQHLYANDTSHRPFQFGISATTLNPEAPASSVTGVQRSSVSASPSSGFAIGSSDTKQTARVCSWKTGMFSNKNNVRKNATTVFNQQPEPSPGFSSNATPSPFATHERRGRKSARNTAANSFATTTLPPFTTEAEDPSCSKAAKAGIWNNHAFVAKPSTARDGFDGVFQAQQSACGQDLNAPSAFTLKVSSQSAKRREDATRPAFAGSRRILRAALRNVGSRADRTQSASPSTLSNTFARGDADMDEEDERNWEELKRLGNVAHCARRFQDAAEYYRQSIEVLDSLLYHEAVENSTEIRTDKAKLHANRAASLLMLMQITEAQHECRRSIEVDAAYASAYLRLGRIQVLLGDPEHAQVNLQTAKDLMEDPCGKVKAGDKADHASLIKMEAKIKKLVGLQGQIKWYVDSGEHDQALVHTDSALTLAPKCRKLQVQKAQSLLHLRKFDELVHFCASLIERHQATQQKLSCGPHGSDGKAKARDAKMMDKITILGIELSLLWATALHYQDKGTEAVHVLSALEAVAPCSSHVIQLKRQWQDMKQLKHSGNEHFVRKEFQEAVRAYSEAVLIDPQHQAYCAIIYCNRAAAQMGLARYHTAILDCNEALQRKPQYPRALLRRARCHVALKMYHEAVKDFERYLHEQSSDAPVDATADVHRERNEAKAAIAKAREEAWQREAAKKRAERDQRQRRNHWQEESSWHHGKFYDNARRGSSTHDSRDDASGGGRSSFMAPKTQRRTHYDVLGIGKKATDDQIRKAYRKLALVYHPDKAKTANHSDLFKEMTAAYNVLSDGSARSKYDRELVYNRFGTFYED